MYKITVTINTEIIATYYLKAKFYAKDLEQKLKQKFPQGEIKTEFIKE